MNLLKGLSLAVVALSLSACAGTSPSSGVNVTSQTNQQFAPVPLTSVRVSSYPPKGGYVIVALLKTDAQAGDTPTQILQRLQQQAANMGANYVMVTSVADKTIFTPQSVDGNPYLDSERGFFATASPDATGYNSVNNVASGTYQREVVKAQALKITSGSNAPNKKARSMVWQMNQ